MTLADSTNSTPRIRSDGIFISTLAVLGGTYVLLIILLLVGDVAYLFNAQAKSNIFVTFDTEGFSSGANKKEEIVAQLAKYGLTIEGTPELHIFDSVNPVNPLWGSPHQDYGGTGAGAGGRSTQTQKNNKQLGNILTPGIIDQGNRGELIFRWKQPVTLRSLQIFSNRKPVEIQSTQLDGTSQRWQTERGSGPGSLHNIPFAEVQTNTLKVVFPDGGGVSGLQFSWPGRLYAPWEYRFPLLSGILHNPVTEALSKPEIRYSIALSLISCTVTAIISIWIAVPLGYLLSRYTFFGKGFIDAILDIPIILPPLVVGLSLLILFQFMPVAFRDAVVYQIPAVILAQVSVACAFAVRTMKAAFDQIDPRCEQVALTLGCSRAAAFSRVVLPEALPGMLTAGTLAWARALGEFGPLLIFAGATRYKTEVLSTSVFLELSVGDLSAAVAISMIMVIAAVIVLILTRMWGTKTISL